MIRRIAGRGLVVVGLVACGGGGSDGADGIAVRSAKVACDKQKLDVTDAVRAACEGKTSCTCERACWSGGNDLSACKSLGFEASYKAGTTEHFYGSTPDPSVANPVFTIGEDGKPSFH